jgi:NADH-quinone oxidoreductase subunit A
VNQVTSQIDVIRSVAFFGGAVILLVTFMLLLSNVLGQRHHDRATGEPYESGMILTGSARMRFDIKFYLVAILFVVFDLEAVFVFSWAVALRELGWAGYIEMLIFIGVLAAALVYLWRMGALDWGTRTGSRGRGSGVSGPRNSEQQTPGL